MTAKTKKELHAENVLLKEQLADMKTKFSELTVTGVAKILTVVKISKST